MKLAIVYHRADYDGLMSAAIALKTARDGGHDVTLEGWDFGDPVPTVNDGEFYGMLVVDLPHDVCPNWVGKSGFAWIDHHKSSIARVNDICSDTGCSWNDLFPGGYCVREGVAACRLTWEYLETLAEPDLVRLLGEYDVWDLHDPRAVPLQYGLVATRNGRSDIEEIERLIVDHDVDKLVEIGRHIQTWHRELCNGVAKERTYITTNSGVKFLTLCSAHARGSFWFGDLSDIDPSTYNALLAWRYTGSRVHVSMYHAEHAKHLDLSEIARLYGGGGHRGACGCEMSLEEFQERFPNAS